MQNAASKESLLPTKGSKRVSSHGKLTMLTGLLQGVHSPLHFFSAQQTCV